MDWIIRQELAGDKDKVAEVIRRAFHDVPQSDQTETELVDRLRSSEAFIPELSLVAVWNAKIVGHVLLTRIWIDCHSATFDSLALAPVSVLPEFQKRGIGGSLIQRAHDIARKKGFKSVALVGHAGYYPKFGYRRASQFRISFPFEVPDENAMMVELIPGGLAGVSGIVRYPGEFY